MEALELIQGMTSAPAGLCGAHDPAAPVSTVGDPERRLSILTLGAIMDVFPLPDRWVILAGLADHWLVSPPDAAYRSSADINHAFKDLGIQGPEHNARVWWQVCRGVQGRFEGRFRDLLAASGDDAFQVLAYLLESKTTFPVLSGPVISARWLDLVHRIGDVPLLQWEELVVPLSPRQIETAGWFGITAKTAHPMTAQALSVWPLACARLEPPQCGLVVCPRR